MKKSLVLFSLLIAVVVGLTITGFQCGSPALTSAKLYIQRQEWANAESSLTTEVQKNPANAEAWYLLGDVRRNMGNYQGMMEAFDKSLSVSPEFSKKISDTKLFVWVGVMKRAIGNFRSSTTVSQDSAVALRDSSIADYKTAIAVLPDSLASYVNLAIAYHIAGDYDNEITTLKSALAQKKDTETYISLINAYISKAERAKQNGKQDEATSGFNDAIAALTDARAQQPDNPELLGTLINLYIEADRAKEAIPLLEEALAKDPKNKVYQNNLGLLLLQTGNFDEAVKHFEAAIAIDDTYEEGLWNGAVAYMKWGEKIKEENQGSDSKAHIEKFKAAAKIAEKLVAIKKDVPKYWEGLATAYANAGMNSDAQKALEQADALRKK